jgi:hypothetical protein
LILEMAVKADDVSLNLSRSEALVFFELLTLAEDAAAMPPIGEAERRVIWRIHAQLEGMLHEPFAPDYVARLHDARAAVLKDELLRE